MIGVENCVVFGVVAGGCVRNEIRGAVGVRIGSVVCNGVQCIFVCRLWC